MADERNGQVTIGTDEIELVADTDAETRFRRRAFAYKYKTRPTTRYARPDVLESEIPRRKTIVWNFPARGVSGEIENRSGALHMAEGCNNLIPGALRAGSNTTFANSADEPCEPLQPIVFNGITFTFHGRYVYAYSNGAVATDNDFGTGVIATGAIVHNSELVVGFGGSTNKIFTRNTSGTWTQASNNTYADLFARTTNQLWRLTATNQVSNISATANPLTLAGWSTGITVGDPTTGGTCLLGVGERVFVCKPEGMFPGDAGAKFPNVLDGFVNQIHPDNGKRAIAVGAVIYYPHEGGLIKYDTISEVAEEIGIQTQIGSAATDKAPGTRIYGLAADGHYIWAAASIGGYPRDTPQYVKKTIDNGANYTNLLTNTTDNDMSTTGDLSSLDTVANGDWLVVGYTEAFAGVLFEMVRPNVNTSTMTVDFSSSGGGWNAITMSAIDRTSRPLVASPTAQGVITLAQSGYVLWPQNGTASGNTWAATTVDGVSAFWVRFKFSAALDSTVTVGEIRVLKSQYGSSQTGWIYRGRPAIPSDGVEQSIVWEPYDALGDMVFPFGLCVTAGVYPHRRGRTLVVSAFAGDTFLDIQPAWTLFETGPQSLSRGNNLTLATSCRHDGGTPNIKKQFHSITVQGKNIDSVRDVKLEYRTDFSTTWTTASSSITSSPTVTTLSGVTGYRVQWRITFNAFTATNEQATEVNLVECDYSEIPANRTREWDLLLKLPLKGRTDPKILLSNLEGYVDDAAVTWVDPLRRTGTSANILELGSAELYTPESGAQAYAVPCRLVEI